MEPNGDISASESLDPTSLGFMCGLEIHQQLDTNKLHSRMSSDLFDYKAEEIPDFWPRTSRRLRASEGESGSKDVAARFEQRRHRIFEYVQTPNAGLIELDEAPPSTHDSEAVDIALTIAAMMEAKPIPSLQAMRKTVVDGSNTSGFQRTTIIATAGILRTESGDVGIDLISLEEDSARKLSSKQTNEGELVLYTLDRLGVPLVEIATSPDIKSPNHAKQTAVSLGRLLRDTRRVRRGLGSIRQDLNVSIACGSRVEIKGCQDLEWIPRIISLEMARQLHFYRLANELRANAALPPLPPNRDNDAIPVENRVALAASKIIPMEIHDLSEVFHPCPSDFVSSSLEQGHSVLAISIPGFSGMIGSKVLDSNGAQLPRLGRELASSAKLAGVSGIFHSDELPAYGISQDFVDATSSKLCLSQEDAFVLCIAPEWQAKLALEAVIERCRLSFHRIPNEVRNVVVKRGKPDDGTTVALRPLPGGARMYPETDVPMLEIKQSRWKEACENLPMTQKMRKNRLKSLEISSNQMEAILNAELDEILFDGIEGELNLPSKAWASALLEHGTDKINPLAAAIHLREIGTISRDGVSELVRDAESDEIEVLLDWMKMEATKRNLVPADSHAIDDVVEKVISENFDLARERGLQSMGPLMGLVMKELGGTADGKAVSEALRSRLSEFSD